MQIELTPYTFQHGDAPIHVACRDGLLNLVESLCALGCNIDVPNKVRKRDGLKVA